MKKNTRLLALTLLLLALATIGGYRFWVSRQQETRWQTASETRLLQAVKDNPSDGAALYYLAAKRQKAGDVALSQRLLTASLKAAPERMVTWLALAELTESKGDIEQAVSILTEMQTRFPQNADAPLRLSNIYLAREAFTPALDAAKKATTLTPNNPTAWSLLGRAHIGLFQFAEAKVALEKAVALAPKDWVTLLSLGDLALEQKEYASATTHYRACTTLAPDQPIPWLSLAHSLVRQRDITPEQQTEAEKALQKAQILSSTVALYPFIEGKLRLHQKRWQEALVLLTKAHQLDLANPEIVFDQSHALRGLGNTAELQAVLQLHRTLTQANQRKTAILSELQRRPAPARVKTLQIDLARIYQTQGRFWDAYQLFQKLGMTTEMQALEKNPLMQQQRLKSQPSADLVKEANQLLQEEKFQEAFIRFSTVVQRDPNNAIALQGMGLSLWTGGRTQEAVPYFTRAAELKPDLVASQFYLGEAALTFGLVQEAITRLEKASLLDPQSAKIWYRYHQALGRMDSKFNEQIAALQKAITLEPDNVTYKIELGEVLVDTGKFDEAEQSFRAAHKLAPKDVESLSRLGGFLAASRTTPEAYTESASLLAEAVKQSPQHEYTLYSLGVLALKRGNFADAIAKLQPVAERNPQMQEIWYQLSRAYASSGKSAEASATLERSRTIQKEYVEFQSAQEKLYDDVKNTTQRLKVARLCMKYNQPLKAMAHYRVLLTQDPKNLLAQKEKNVLEQQLVKSGKIGQFAAYEDMLATSSRAAENNAKKL
jgi:tetratricopeptide (TPR) repeat protein